MTISLITLLNLKVIWNLLLVFAQPQLNSLQDLQSADWHFKTTQCQAIIDDNIVTDCAWVPLMIIY